MNATSFDVGVAIAMLAVAIALVVWFWRYMAAASGRRMARMLARAGVDAEIIRQGDSEAIIRDVRSRCRSCAAEDLCERWLDGKVEGENGFCPNAPIFRALKVTAARTA